MRRAEDQKILWLIKLALNTTIQENSQVSDDITANLWEKIFACSERHQITGLIYDGIQKIKKPLSIEPNLLKKFQKEAGKDELRELIQDAELSTLTKELTLCGLDYCLLKGSVWKQYYPVLSMRRMADIDLLIRADDRERIKELMGRVGYEYHGRSGNHDEYFRLPVMNVELHFSLFCEDFIGFPYYSCIWDRLKQEREGSHQYTMTLEEQLVYHIAHWWKHCQGAGTGLRPIIDLWVFLKKERMKLDWIQVQRMAELAGVWPFSEQVISLAGCWFEDEPSDAKLDSLENYLWNGSLYGTYETGVLNALSRTVDGRSWKAKATFLVRKCFPSCRIMTTTYPQLANRKMMLPFCYIHRIIRFVLFRPVQLKSMLRTVGAASIDRLKEEQWNSNT